MNDSRSIRIDHREGSDIGMDEPLPSEIPANADEIRNDVGRNDVFRPDDGWHPWFLEILDRICSTHQSSPEAFHLRGEILRGGEHRRIGHDSIHGRLSFCIASDRRGFGHIMIGLWRLVLTWRCDFSCIRWCILSLFDQRRGRWRGGGRT